MIKSETGAQLAELMTAAQVARELGYTREAVRQAVARGHLQAAGKLPARNGAYLFARADVEAWLARPSRLGGRTVYVGDR